MSDEQETIPEANAPKPIRIDKRSLFTPSEAVAVEQHSTTPHVSRTRYGTARIEVASPPPMREYPQSYRNIAAASQSKAIRSNRSPIPPTLRSSVIPMPTPFSPSTRSLENR